MLLGFAQLEPAEMVFLASLGAAIWLLMSNVRRYFRRQRAAQTVGASSKPVAHGAASHQAVPRSLEQWQIEMHDFAREVAATLDSKISLVQRLVIDAEAAATRLEEMLARAEDERAGEHPAPSPWREQLSAPRASSVRAESDARFRHIYELADSGLPPTSIAERLETQVGEVELILSLRSAGDQ